MRTELFLNNTRVDMMEEVQASLNLMIADIRDPKSRKGSFSKTIKLPASKTIDKLLGGIFDIAEDIQTTGIINFVPDFNPNLKCTAILYADGLEQFNGIMRLLSIDRDQQNFAKIIYNVIITGDVSNIYSAMSDKKLTDLDLSSYNHNWTKPIQKATWTASIDGNGYVYAMIDYGKSSPVNAWQTTDFYPATYLKTLIDAIFLDAGFTYTSTFFDSAFFKHLIIPYSGEGLKLTPAEITSRLFSSYLTFNLTTATVPITFPFVQSTITPIVFNAETLDPSNQYNIANGRFTVLNDGFYEFYIDLDVDGICSASGTINAPVTGSLPCTIAINLVTSNAGTFPCVSTSFNLTHGVGYNIGDTIYSKQMSGTSQVIFLQAGAYVDVQWQLTIVSNLNASHSSSPLAIQNRILSGAVFKNIITNANIYEGGVIDLSSTLPIDIRQADLFSSVIQTFNLFCEIDKTTPNNLIIDTYDNFYDTGAIRDWTLKVDVSKTMTITPMGALDALRYQIKYSDDTDYWNKFYREKYKKSYGEKNVDIINDFLKNTNKNEVLFAPTPLIGDSSTDRIIPEIYSIANSGVKGKVQSKMRLLYWNGTLATNNTWNYYSSNSGVTVESVYPFAGHVDNPYSPTLDLCFGVPSEIYYSNPYGVTTYTNNNLYNQYHSKFIEEITDRNSKLIVLYVYLNALDIFNISFRDLIYIDNHYYRLQKIIDHNPINPQPTKVELLKIKNGIPYVAQSKEIDFTGDASFNNNDRTPLSGGNIGRGDLKNIGNNSVIGDSNYVSKTSSGSIIGGQNNRVGNNTNMVSILNSSGVAVLGELTNVSVINTNDITISESNVSYVNGIRIIGENSIYEINQSQNIGGAGVYLCTGVITITMDTKFLRAGDTIMIKRNAGGVVTISGGGINIDGAATFTLSTLYDSLTIYYNGDSYSII